MIVTSIAGNINSAEGKRLQEGSHVEKVYLPSQDLVKRIQRMTTDHGREIGLRLPAGSPDLEDGDILAIEEPSDGENTSRNLIVVSVETSDIIVIAARSIKEMAFVAHSLGNRHLPAQFFDEDSDFGAQVMVVQYDRTVQDFLDLSLIHI